MVNIPSMLLCVVQTAVKLLETRIDSVKAATDPSASALAPAAAAAAAVSRQPAAAHDSQHSTPAVSTSAGAALPSPVALEAPAGPATASTSAAAVHSGSAVPEASVNRSAHQTSTSAPQAAPQAVSDAPCAQTDSTATPGAVDASATSTTAEVAASSDAAVPDPTGVEGTRGFAGESIAGLQAEAAQKELADLESVLEDMYEKVEELQQIVKEQISTKNALKVSTCVQCLLHLARNVDTLCSLAAVMGCMKGILYTARATQLMLCVTLIQDYQVQQQHVGSLMQAHPFTLCLCIVLWQIHATGTAVVLFMCEADAAAVGH